MAIYVNVHSQHSPWEKKKYCRVIVDIYGSIEPSPSFLAEATSIKLKTTISPQELPDLDAAPFTRDYNCIEKSDLNPTQSIRIPVSLGRTQLSARASTIPVKSKHK